MSGAKGQTHAHGAIPTGAPACEHLLLVMTRACLVCGTPGMRAWGGKDVTSHGCSAQQALACQRLLLQHAGFGADTGAAA